MRLQNYHYGAFEPLEPEELAQLRESHQQSSTTTADSEAHVEVEHAPPTMTLAEMARQRPFVALPPPALPRAGLARLTTPDEAAVYSRHQRGGGFDPDTLKEGLGEAGAQAGGEEPPAASAPMPEPEPVLVAEPVLAPGPGLTPTSPELRQPALDILAESAIQALEQQDVLPELGPEPTVLRLARPEPVLPPPPPVVEALPSPESVIGIAEAPEEIPLSHLPRLADERTQTPSEVDPTPAPAPEQEAVQVPAPEQAKVLTPDPVPTPPPAVAPDPVMVPPLEPALEAAVASAPPLEPQAAPAPIAEAPSLPLPTPAPAPAPEPSTVTDAAPPAAPAPLIPAAEPASPSGLPLPLGGAVAPDWQNQREAALVALRTDFEASREAARHALPADVASAAGTAWTSAPTDADGNATSGAIWVPDAAAAASAPDTGWPTAWQLRDGGGVPAAPGRWLAFDDGAYEQTYRERLAARTDLTGPLTILANLYNEPARNPLAAHPELWALATQDHALNAGPAPRPGMAMGDARSLGELDLYLADPFITQVRDQFGGSTAAPTSTLALEQQRLYGAQRYAELTRLSQAMGAVRQAHADAMRVARDGGGTGWVDVPMQTGTDPQTGWATGIYATVGDGEIQRDANGAPVLATQRVFDEALATNAWLEQPGLAQDAFARFYGRAQSHIALRDQGGSDATPPPVWESQASLDNPHVGLMEGRLWDGDLITLDLNHSPRLNNDSAIGFDPQLGWVTARENLHEHRDFMDRVAPVAFTAFMAWATAGAATAAGLGPIASAAVTGAVAATAGGIANDNLSLKGILIGAVSGALTAGLTPQLTSALADLGPAAGIAARMTVQGGIQALLGGKFKDGAIAGFASGLADLAKVNLEQNIQDAVRAGTMSATDALAARTFNTMLSGAIRAAGTPGDPAQAFASNWLEGVMRDNLPAMQAPEPSPAPAPVEGDGDGVQTYPVPGPAPVVAAPLPPTNADLSAMAPGPGESDSQFVVRMMREVFGPDVDLKPLGEHNQYQLYRDEKGQLVVSDGTGLNRPVDPRVNAAFEALLAQRMQQLNAIAAVQRSQAFADWALANNRPVADTPEPGVWNQRIPFVADVRDFLLSQIDQAVAKTSGSGQVALEGLRIAVEAITPETFGDVALNELGAGVLKAGMPLAGVFKAAAVESRLGREVKDLLQTASREGGDVAGHLLGNAAETEAREAGRIVMREVPGKKGEWNGALNGDLRPDATYILTNGHSYTTDAFGRVTKAEGALNPATVDRNAYQQLIAGKAGGDGYDGGHLIGTLVGGAGEKINLVAQLSSVNRGEFRVMEKTWAEAMQAGSDVRVVVSPVYLGSSQVPSKIEVDYWIDGRHTFRQFKNVPG